MDAKRELRPARANGEQSRSSLDAYAPRRRVAEREVDNRQWTAQHLFSASVFFLMGTDLWHAEGDAEAASAHQSIMRVLQHPRDAS